MEKLKIIEKLRSYMTKANGEKAWNKYIGSQLEEDIVNFIVKEKH